MTEITLSNVERVEIEKPRLISDCAYYIGEDGRCKNEDGTPCNQDQCKKWTPIEIHITHEGNVDTTFTNIVLEITNTGNRVLFVED